MSDFTFFHILLAVVFLLANAFFVAAEFALVKVRGTRIEVLAKRGDSFAHIVKGMVDNLDGYLSATQLGITLASLGLGWIGEPAFAQLIKGVFGLFGFSVTLSHSTTFTLAFIFMSYLHIIIGELVPKSMAIQMPESVCKAIAIPLRLFYLLFFPFLWSLNKLSWGILRIFKFKPEGGPARAHTEEELKLIVEDSFEEGNIAQPKRVLLDKAIEFSNRKVKDIMIGADKMVCFYLDQSIHQNVTRLKESNHSRAPLLESKGGKVLGFVHMKDIIWSYEEGDLINLYDLCRPLVYFLPDTKLDSALKEFQKSKIHIGIVQTPDQKTLGVITLEDVIEQLVGSIEDEFD